MTIQKSDSTIFKSETKNALKLSATGFSQYEPELSSENETALRHEKYRHGCIALLIPDINAEAKIVVFNYTERAASG